MRQRDRLRALEEENAALKQRLAARVALDKTFFANLHAIVGAVALNISQCNQIDRERVLLAVAALYGIIGPRKPKEKPNV